jgi:hypothetical protein
MLLIGLITCREVVKLSSFFDIREHNIICLSSALESYNCNGISLDSDISSDYTNLTNVLHWFISQFIPVKQVTITDNCPPFVTPLIKSLLRKRNKLLRKNKLDKAVALNEKIGQLILERRSELLSQIDFRSSKELWASVNPTVKGGSSFKSLSCRFGNMFSDLNGINAYFANIATDPHNDSNKTEQVVSSLPHSDNFRDVMFNEYEVFNLLSKVEKSSAGVDKLQY